ncbi:UxaA family hydrolase [Anaerococcus porci]|uniref:UxaA family hydrolase n=1 Tax=Anaerococcus porci TaxID=2652269 RepID=UPI002A759832|nr:UxaA family hydrolase [Anaerococcus porci]MDY3006686.1 UxaA family hydrolase [Anaerococcus porci]
MELKYIKINQKDNNVTVVNAEGIEKGDNLKEYNIIVKDFVPLGNKIAIQDINKDLPIIRYGEIIGYADRDIKAGELIDFKSIHVNKVKTLDIDIPYKSRKVNDKKNKERYFYGYENKDGTVGTKNLLAISTNVQCSEGFINKLVDYIKNNLLGKYENVDDVVTVSHTYGCGVAIDALDSEIPQRIINNIIKNPNFGGEVMMICLGCEKFTPDKIEAVSSEDILVQQNLSFHESFQKAIEMAEIRLKRLNKRNRKKFPLSKLRIGLQCGGSDALSGVTANPTMGYVADRLVEYGASVIFSEVTEVRDASNIILSRIKDKDLRKKYINEINWYDDYLEKSQVDRSANPSPGNKAGGLTTVIDKAMGSVAKSGISDITDILLPGELIKKPGLTFAATPASDFVCGTCQLASGINMMLFSSGRGTTYNLAHVPVIKIATNNVLAKKWGDLIDFNTGDIAIGKSSVDEKGEELLDYIIDVASGVKITKSDQLGLYNALVVFNPAPIT